MFDDGKVLLLQLTCSLLHQSVQLCKFDIFYM